MQSLIVALVFSRLDYGSATQFILDLFFKIYNHFYFYFVSFISF